MRESNRRLRFRELEGSANAIDVVTSDAATRDIGEFAVARAVRGSRPMGLLLT